MSQPFTVLRAGGGHLALAREAALEVHERAPFDEDALVGFLSDASCYLFLAVEDGKVLGSLNGYRLRQPNRREPEFLLYEIDVRPGCRRRGVGRALVDAFAAEARAAGAFEVWLLSNESSEAAMALYRRCGFRRRNEDDVMLSLSV